MPIHQRAFAAATDPIVPERQPCWLPASAAHCVASHSQPEEMPIHQRAFAAATDPIVPEHQTCRLPAQAARSVFATAPGFSVQPLCHPPVPCVYLIHNEIFDTLLLVPNCHAPA